MTSSVEFFDTQFQRQIDAGAIELNPFEAAAVPYLRGRVLDFGCGLGALAITAARRGCSVLALDASHSAIEHLRQVAAHDALPIEAREVDLRNYRLTEDFDTVVSIGLLMFFDCPTALQQLAQLQSRVRAGGALRWSTSWLRARPTWTCSTPRGIACSPVMNCAGNFPAGSY